ncbi:5129_t:CDS:2 [Ambispora gerdemannii]|uniref:5129_t:CDS:1 n=1 Tax=Ambispora gerdemannii TaxID=144530 RepID=A0A9N9B6X9_9GLOM|nr:5129_t:CDS:2 [Ambispora gerdemannii]
MQRPQSDPISPHANRLVAYMNGHPDTILTYAKYFGKEKNAVSAQMTSIDSAGFTVKVTKEDGDEEEIIIQFKQKLTGHEQVRGVLTEMAKDAEEALNLPSTRPPSPPPSSTTLTNNIHTPFIWPNPFVASLIAVCLIILYTPDYFAPQLHPFLREYAYIDWNSLYATRWLVLALHLGETSIVAWILAKKGEPDMKTWFLWISFTMFLGGLVANHLWNRKEKKRE